MRSKSGGGSSKVRREAGVSRREVTRAAGGVVAARTALAGAARTPRRVCCLPLRERVGVGKGGAGSRGEQTAGRARVRDPRLPEAARTVETMNHPVTARERPTGPASPASSPGLRGRAARGAGWARGRGRGRVGEDFAPSQVARWAARPGADPGRPWAGEPADAAPGLLSKV